MLTISRLLFPVDHSGEGLANGNWRKGRMSGQSVPILPDSIRD